MTASAANAGGLVTKHAASVQLTVDAARSTATRIGSSFGISGSNVATTDGQLLELYLLVLSPLVYIILGTISAVQDTDESAFLIQSIFTQGDAVPTSAPTVGDIQNFGSMTSYTLELLATLLVL